MRSTRPWEICHAVQDGSTRVQIDLAYNPLIGALGHIVATLFARGPKRQMHIALQRLETTIETGAPPHDASARAPGMA